ncbi:MAG: hypothetical protein LBQ39_06965 [Tannerellaceae bacterium]|jgi:hypothetical protein|nr:hypothetical protein [Tannerellaceae bacterium]
MTDAEKIKEYAACLMSIPDIAVLMGVDVDSLRGKIADRSSAISIAYYQGKAETTLAIRRQEVELAKAGSPLAVERTSDYLVEQSQHEL